MMQKFDLGKSFTAQSIARQLVYVVLFNTAIAVFLKLILKEAQFINSLVISQCIGLTMFSAFNLFGYFYGLRGWRIAIPLLGGAMLGVVLGIMVVGLMHGKQITDIGNAMTSRFDRIFSNLIIALFFGVIILFFFLSRERIHRTGNELQEVRIKNLDHKKQIAETRLQLLQAQVEPHFLFNSLSNVISLIESDPVRAKQMLESLTRYLRTSLSRSQEQAGTIKDEIDLIENYLAIIKIRMGDRLDYAINAAEDMWQTKFPPMLLQPLVENAIHHGLEPIAEGGRIDIELVRTDGGIRIDVSDNGAGFKTDALSGFGLANIRQRLQSLYGDKGQLHIGPNKPSGVRASIEINDE